MKYITKNKILNHFIEHKPLSIRCWKNEFPELYEAASQKEWFYNVARHFYTNIFVINWSKDKVEELLKNAKYNSISEWSSDKYGSLVFARQQSWYLGLVISYFSENCAKMRKSRKIDYTRDYVESEIERLCIASIGDWQEKSMLTYAWAFNQPFYEAILTKYKLRKRSKYHKHTKEEVERNLKNKKYKNITEWIADNQKQQTWCTRQDFYYEIKNKYFPEARKLNPPHLEPIVCFEKYSDELKASRIKSIYAWGNDLRFRATYNWAKKNGHIESIAKLAFGNKYFKEMASDIEIALCDYLESKDVQTIDDWASKESVSYNWALEESFFNGFCQNYFKAA